MVNPHSVFEVMEWEEMQKTTILIIQALVVIKSHCVMVIASFKTIILSQGNVEYSCCLDTKLLLHILETRCQQIKRLKKTKQKTAISLIFFLFCLKTQ